MLDLLNGDNDAGVRCAPTGGRSASVSLDNAVINAKCVRACACVGLIDGAVNTGVHLDESDSTYEAVRALHAAK